MGIAGGMPSFIVGSVVAKEWMSKVEAKGATNLDTFNPCLDPKKKKKNGHNNLAKSSHSFTRN